MPRRRSEPSGPPEALYPVSEVAKLWRCSADHVYDLIAAGKLRAVDISASTKRTKLRVPESALAEYVNRYTLS